MFNEGEYFNTDSEKCSFTDSNFAELLKCSALLPETIQSDSQNWGKAYANELKLMMCEIDEFLLLDLLISDVVFHGEANFIGFPSGAGTGVAILPVLQLGMSVSSDDQAGVWEFFKFLLSD